MKQQKHPPLLKARTYFKARKFKHVIRVLEPEIYNYRDSFQYYYLLGLAYLFDNESDSGESYLRRAYQIDSSNITIMEGLACACFRKDQYDEALKIYLEILELEPKNQKAKRGLAIIRKAINLENDVERLNTEVLLPRLKLSPWRGKGFFIVIIIILLSGGGTYLLYKPTFHFDVPTMRPGLEKYNFPQNGSSQSGVAEEFLYTLSSAEIEDSFNKAKRYFNQYRDNLALVEVNRLIHSNASDEIKNIVNTLKDHVLTPDFSTIRDSFSLSEIYGSPFLYSGCHVTWTGKVGSLDITDDVLSFDLWIGDEHHFEGVVPVRLDFPSTINNGNPVQVLGKVQIDSDGNISLKGVSIHKVLTP